MEQKELQEILAEHKNWLYGNSGKRADLCYANLCGADLCDADLRGANLRDAKYSKLVDAQLRIIPEGDIIGWKKLAGGLICKLLIPADAKRSNATGRKCRAEYAKVLNIYDGEKEVLKGHSNYNFIYLVSTPFDYIVGEYVYADSYDEDRWNECSHGIHFFITREEAEEYV